MPVDTTRALCLGGASCVWDDVLALEALHGKPWDGVVIAANDIGSHWPRDLHHWVSLHAAKIDEWRRKRDEQQLPRFVGTTWSRQPARGYPPQTDRVLDAWAGGSSGMFAVQVAQVLGCTKVVCCGIPMTETAHFSETFEHFHTRWLAAAGHWRAWQRFEDHMRGWCTSMSGRTRELLGAPTREWLTGERL